VLDQRFAVARLQVPSGGGANRHCRPA
jgi:hypothetical protein